MMEKFAWFIKNSYRTLSRIFTSSRSVFLFSILQAAGSLSLLISCAVSPPKFGYLALMDSIAFYAVCFIVACLGIAIPFLPQKKWIILPYFGCVFLLVIFSVGSFWMICHRLEVNGNECQLTPGPNCMGLIEELKVGRARSIIMPILYGISIHAIVSLSIQTIGRKITSEDFRSAFERKRVRFS